MSSAAAHTSSPTAFCDDEYNFHTITCITWNAAGRNVGLGTPDGFIIFSTESTLEDYISRTARTSAATSLGHSSETPPRVTEVCRRVVSGGVGMLALCGQSSVVAIAGVASQADASRVSLVDASYPLDPADATVEDDNSSFHGSLDSPSGGSDRIGESGSGSSLAERLSVSKQHGAGYVMDEDDPHEVVQSRSPGVKAGKPPLILPADHTDLRPLVLAEALFPAAVSSVNFSPHFILVAVGGEPRIAGSHKLYVFDPHLQQKFVLSPQPLRSNRFFRDCISIASSWTVSSGAGMSIRRLRTMLPGPQKGSVRLMTLKRVSFLSAGPTLAVDEVPSAHFHSATASPTPFVVNGSYPIHYSQLFHPSEQQSSHRSHRNDSAGITCTATDNGSDNEEEESLIVYDRVLHEAPLRATAITSNGKYGVTIGERGTNIHLLEFIDDNKVEQRMVLERGKTPAVVDSTSLHIITLPAVSASSGGGGGHVEGAPAADTNRSPRVLVACITSTGTLHLFFCDVASATLVTSREKSLCPPPGRGFPFSFAAFFPEPTITRGRCALHVLQWQDADLLTVASLAAQRRLGTQESGASASAEDRRRAYPGAHQQNPQLHRSSGATADIRLVAFDVSIALPSSPSRQQQQVPRQYAKTVGTRTLKGDPWRTSSSFPSTSVAGGLVTCKPYRAFDIHADP